MWELLIGIFCCLGMMGTLFGYLKWYSKKYRNGQDPSSLSSTFYKVGWKFRLLLISLALWMIYPILLANGIYTSGGWLYYSPTVLLSFGKLAYAIAAGGILGVALNSFDRGKEHYPHVIAAGALAAGGSILGSVLRPEWYIGVAIWLAWLLYYIWKNYKNNKAGNKRAWDLYIELVAFYSVPTCLIVFMLINYFS